MSGASSGIELVIELRIGRLILDGAARDSHRGDPRDFSSVDMEYCLATDASPQERVERPGSLAPRCFELDLGVQAPVGHQPGKTGEIPGPAAVGCEFVREVQCVDPRPLRAVEARGVEGDGLISALRCEIDDDATRGDVLDRKSTRLNSSH